MALLSYQIAALFHRSKVKYPRMEPALEKLIDLE